jgi:hypothetical protein
MVKGLDLRMRGAGGAVPPPGEEASTGGDDDGAYGGIGAGAAHTAAGLAEGEAHPGFVRGHGEGIFTEGGEGGKEELRGVGSISNPTRSGRILTQRREDAEERRTEMDHGQFYQFTPCGGGAEIGL